MAGSWLNFRGAVSIDGSKTATSASGMSPHSGLKDQARNAENKKSTVARGTDIRRLNTINAAPPTRIPSMTHSLMTKLTAMPAIQPISR